LDTTNDGHFIHYFRGRRSVVGIRGAVCRDGAVGRRADAGDGGTNSVGRDDSERVMRILLKDGMRPVAVGLLLGISAAFGLMRILQAVLLQVSPADPITFIGVSIILVLAALFGCLIPARRATRVDPVAALRHE
jgi:hypothetical protein